MKKFLKKALSAAVAVCLGAGSTIAAAVASPERYRVQAAYSINGVGTLAANNTTVTYDGSMHYPDITFIPAEGLTDYTLQYRLGNAETTYDTLPGFTNVGVYQVYALLKAGGTEINVSCTLTIEANDSGAGGGSGDESGSGAGDSGDTTEYTPSRGAAYVKEQFIQSLNSYDSLGTDRTFHIDCEKYQIKNGSAEYYELLAYLAGQLYSDSADAEDDTYNFRLPTRFQIRDIDFDMDATGQYIKEFQIIFRADMGTQTDINTKYHQIVSRTDDILQNRSDFKGSFDYMLFVHDGMCREIDFAYQDYQEGNGGVEELHTADGVLANGRGLCDGYAYVFKYLMDRAGIPCRVVCSRNLNHCWNMVEIDGYWFHIDVAWDDLVTTQAAFTGTFSNAAEQLTMYGETNTDYNDIGWVSHAYFLRNDTQMKALGYTDWDTYYPEDVNKQNTHPPVGTNTNATANGVFENSAGAFSLIGDTWYSADKSGTSKEINRWDTLNSAAAKVTMPVAVRYLTTDGTYLYYVNGDSVYRSLPDGSRTWKYTPTINGGESYPITEFAYKGGKLVTVLSAPNIASLTLSEANSDSLWMEYTDGGSTAGNPDNYWGDLNGDERVDLKDAQLALRIALHIPADVTPEGRIRGDVIQAGDGITLEDAQAILKRALRIDVRFDVE